MSGVLAAVGLAVAVAWLARLPALGGGVLVTLLALEIAGVVTDTLGLRAVLGESAQRVRPRAWIRSVAAACAARALVPFGRPLGEVLRAGALADDLGRTRAAQLVAHFQIAVLVGDVVGAIVLASILSAREHLVSIAREIPLSDGASSVVVAAAVLAAAAALALSVLMRWVAPDPLPSGSSTAVAAAHRVLGGAVRTAQWLVVLYAASEPVSLGDALTQQGLAVTGTIGLGDHFQGASLVVAAMSFAAILATSRA